MNQGIWVLYKNWFKTLYSEFTLDDFPEKIFFQIAKGGTRNGFYFNSANKKCFPFFVPSP
jgi:hypothetical protein